MKCESCGFQNPEDFVFCGQCGKLISPGEKGDWRKYCIYCQFKNKSKPDGTSYCDGCEGEPLEAASLQIRDPLSLDSSSIKGSNKTRKKIFSAQIRWPLIFFFFTLLVFAIAVLSFRWLSFSQTPSAKEKEYLNFADRCIDDYDVIVRRMGEIGNQVFRPEEAGFEERKTNALRELEKLNSEVEKVYRELRSRSAPAGFGDFKEKLLWVYKIIYTKELPELKEFVTVVDHSIVVSMMKGDLNRSPFEKAVLVGEDVSKKMDEVIRLRYLKGVTE